MEHNIQQSLFFDIETTGLSADISAITVIDAVIWMEM